MKKDLEIIVDKRIITDNKNRRIISNVDDSSWGQLILPAEDETRHKKESGMRVVILASYLLGYLLCETLKKLEQNNPGRLNIVGLVTDDPASPQAKISVKRRIWRMYGEKEIIGLETAMIESALMAGVPVYTGAVKTGFFRKLLSSWNPDVILVCVFGQIIDKPIIDYPPYGIYNFHPADLANHHGAGPKPFQELIDRNAKTSKVTIHHLTDKLDAGPIVGQSSPVNVRFADGSITNNILVLDDKMLEPIDYMGTLLMKNLIRRKEEGKNGPLKSLDFAKHFSKAFKQKLMEPIQTNIPSDKLPMPSEFVDFSL